MKTLLACLLASSSALAGETALNTPSPVALNSPVSTPMCSASEAKATLYATVVTGFSADGNFVLGRVPSYYTCGRSGRGGYVRTVYLCTYLTWDLTGALVSSSTSPSTSSVQCPAVTLQRPSTSPPSSTVIGNEFSQGSYTAETLVEEICGSVACYATYLLPQLVTP